MTRTPATLVVSLLAVQLTALVPRPALCQGAAASPADTPKPPTDAAKSEARDRFDRGLKLFNEGDNAGALAEFKRAYELIPNALVLYNIGLVYAAMGRPADAADALGKVVANPGALSADRLARAKQARDEQAGRVAELAVVTNVPAVIEVDNVEAGKTPLTAPLRVSGGSHVVGAFASGYAPLRKEVTIAGGAKGEVKLELAPMEGKAAHLTVRTHLPGADVVVDGQAVGRTPLATSLTVLPGQHKIELRRAGYLPAQQDLTLGEGASGEVAFEPEEDRNTLAREGGTLALDISESQAVVTIDGRPRGAYAGSYTLPKGPHTVLVERGGFLPADRTVSIDSGRATTVAVALDPTPETRAAFVGKASAFRTWGWIGVIGGAALAGGGGGLLAYDAGQRNDAKAVIAEVAAKRTPRAGGACDPASGKENSAECVDAERAAINDWNGANSRDKIAYVVGGVGIAALGAGIVLLLTGDNPHKYDRKHEGGETLGLRVLPLGAVSSSGATFGLAGSF